LLLLLKLLGSELSGRRSAAIFFNKLVVADLYGVPRSQDMEVRPAGHGGEGESRDVMARFEVVILPAGLGGEGESGSSRSLFTGDKIQVRWRVLSEVVELHFDFFSVSSWRRGDRRRWSYGILQAALAFA
jgi:hypothetical protein